MNIVEANFTNSPGRFIIHKVDMSTNNACATQTKNNIVVVVSHLNAPANMKLDLDTYVLDFLPWPSNKMSFSASQFHCLSPL